MKMKFRIALPNHWKSEERKLLFDDKQNSNLRAMSGTGFRCFSVTTSSAQSLASEGSISGEITMNFRAVNVLFRVQISQNHSC